MSGGVRVESYFWRIRAQQLAQLLLDCQLLNVLLSDHVSCYWSLVCFIFRKSRVILRLSIWGPTAIRVATLNNGPHHIAWVCLVRRVFTSQELVVLNLRLGKSKCQFIAMLLDMIELRLGWKVVSRFLLNYNITICLIETEWTIIMTHLHFIYIRHDVAQFIFRIISMI